MNTPLRVATLNIWNRLGPWAERLAAIRAGVERLSPDVLCLQEVLRDEGGGEDAFDQARAIADGFGYSIAYSAAWREGGVAFGNAVLSRYPIARAVTFSLPAGGTDEKRCVAFALLDAPFAKIPVFVTHLNWKLHEARVRREQVLALCAIVAREAPVSSSGELFPAIVTGDFNAEPESDEIRYMKGLCTFDGTSVYFADAFGVAGDGSPGTTFARRNPFAALAHEPNRRLDYIFVRGPDKSFRGEVLSARVCFDAPHAGVFASDHFGVVAEISVGATT